MRLSEAAGVFLRTKRLEGFSPATISSYRFYLDRLARHTGDPEIGSVTLDGLRSYLGTHSHLKPTSIGTEIRSLRSFFKWLTDEEYVVRNPAAKIREPKQPQRVPKALSIEELELLRDGCRTLQERAMVELLFSTGIRVGELHRLDRAAIDWDRRSVVVLGKGSKEREVYFSPRAAIQLRRYLASRDDGESALFRTTRRPWRRLSVHQSEYIMRRIATRAGLAGRVTPHVLRHTFGTYILNQGAPLAAVQSLLGHSKPETTQLYARLSGAARQEAYRKYFAG